MRLGAPPVVFALALALPGAAAAIELSTTSYESLPADAAFRIETPSDDVRSRHVADLVEDALRARGYAVEEAAPLVMAIEVPGGWDDGGEPDLGMFEVGTQHGLELRLNIWSSSEDSLLRPRSRERVAPPPHRIRLSLHDRQAGRYLWHGEAEAEADFRGFLTISREMVPVLVDALGETVQARDAVAADG